MDPSKRRGGGGEVSENEVSEYEVLDRSSDEDYDESMEGWSPKQLMSRKKPPSSEKEQKRKKPSPGDISKDLQRRKKTPTGRSKAAVRKPPTADGGTPSCPGGAIALLCAVAQASASYPAPGVAAAPVAQLGCSKCRYSAGGCGKCGTGRLSGGKQQPRVTVSKRSKMAVLKTSTEYGGTQACSQGVSAPPVACDSSDAQVSTSMNLVTAAHAAVAAARPAISKCSKCGYKGCTQCKAGPSGKHERKHTAVAHDQAQYQASGTTTREVDKNSNNGCVLCFSPIDQMVQDVPICSVCESKGKRAEKDHQSQHAAAQATGPQVSRVAPNHGQSQVSGSVSSPIEVTDDESKESKDPYACDLKRPDSLPLNWERSAPKQLFINVPKDTPEYQSATWKFFQTCKGAKYKVTGVERVQNKELWDMYNMLRKGFIEGRNGSEIDCFHGCDGETAIKIARSGFNRDFAGKHGIVYGKGSYFATTARYSANKTYSPSDKDGNQHMFLCRLVIGHYMQGRAQMITPPFNTSNNVVCDTTGDAATKQDASILVTWCDYQVYPKYRIFFQRIVPASS